MKIKLVHAYFLVTTGDYNNEKVGFTAELEEGDTVDEAIAQMRELAIAAIGIKAEEFYRKNQRLRNENRELQETNSKLRAEWDATAEFLRAQGIKPEAPSMPQFQNLLQAAKPESQSVVAEIIEEDQENDGAF